MHSLYVILSECTENTICSGVAKGGVSGPSPFKINFKNDGKITDEMENIIQTPPKRMASTKNGGDKSTLFLLNLDSVEQAITYIWLDAADFIRSRCPVSETTTVS